jgi:predicted ATPase
MTMFEAADIPLPTYHTHLVGRDTECTAIIGLLTTPTVRLLTLVGESGAGKTRLALEVAATLAERFPDGIAFVSLAPVQDQAFVLPTIATTLQLDEQADQSPLSTLATALATKTMLLILDNIEQVRAVANELVALVRATQHLTLLVTSQMALNIPEETLYHVPPLATPPLEATLHPAVLLGYPAIALFVSRIQAVQPQFQLTAANAAAVIRICQLLDGFPLAIELVAAHSETLSPDNLLLLLRNHLGVHPHHNGMAGSSRADILNPVLNWCIQRLPTVPRRLMLHLGVFLGGWTIESAHAVLAPERTVADVAQALDLLVQKHLILQEAPPGQPLRFTSLDAIRMYSEQLLQKLGQWQPIHHAYAQYYVNLTQAALPAKQGERQRFWVERLETEYHNIRSALHWSSANASALFVQLTITLGWFWRTHCRLREASFWIEQALIQTPRTSALQGRLLYEAGMLAVFQNALPQARDYLERSLAIYQGEGNQVGTAETLNELATVYCNIDDLGRSRDAFERCIAVWRELGRPWEHAVATANLGYIYLCSGLHDQAISAFRTAQAALPAHSDHVLEGNILTNIGWTAYVQGAAANARDHFIQAIVIHQQLKSRLYLPEQLEGLAGCAGHLGQPEHAARLLGAAVQLREQNAAPVPPMDQARYGQIVRSIRQRLDPATFMECWQAGQRYSADALIALAIDEASLMLHG